MPNVVAHIVAGTPVAETITNEADQTMFNLGCILPDFVGMYEDRQEGQKVSTRSVYSPDENPWLDRGVYRHYRTDEAYQRCPIKTNLLNAVVTDFEQVDASFYMSKAAIRACAHVGTKILLDGALLMTQPRLKDLYSQVRESVLRSSDAIAARVDEPVAESIFRFFRDIDDPQENYSNPRWVAYYSLQQRFGRRDGQRLAFPESATELVDYCLSKQLGRLMIKANRIMKFVMEDLSKVPVPGTVSRL